MEKSIKKFMKYHSLGNDFILFDWRVNVPSELSDPAAWHTRVKEICHRNFGIGADGVLALIKNDACEYPEVLIFNQDGSNGQMCLNGIRCVAHYLYTYCQYPSSFFLKMGENTLLCTITPHVSANVLITTTISFAQYEKPLSVTVQQRSFNGHNAKVGNPHFLIFEPFSQQQLLEYGPALEHASVFPQRSNISFLWPINPAQPSEYYMLTYERGCGLTLACGSAAAAAIRTLKELGQGVVENKITLHLLGGTVHGWVTNDNDVCLQAPAWHVFNGYLT